MAKTAKTLYKFSKKRNGRYLVEKRGAAGIVNGEEKVKALHEAGLVKMMTPKKKDEPAGEAPAES